MKVFLVDGFGFINEQEPSEDRSPFKIGAKYSVGIKATDGTRHFNKPHDVMSVVKEKATKDTPVIVEEVRVEVPRVGENEVVVIRHIDPKVLFTLMLMSGRELPDIDLNRDDGLNPRSRSIRFDRLSPAFFYRVGLQQLAKDLELPLVSLRPVEITGIIETMMNKPVEEVIAIGRTEIAKISFDEGFKGQIGNVGFWIVEKGQPSSFARIYQDGMEISVIFIEKYRQIVISSDPKTNYDFGGRDVGKLRNPVEVEGIRFSGSAHSSGSPRGTEYTAMDAERVFQAIALEPEKYIVIPPKRRGGGGDD